MSSYPIVFCVLICLQGIWSYAIDTTHINENGISASIDSSLSRNTEENLSKAMENLKTGFSSLSAPIVKFGLKTVPGLISNSLKTANIATSKLKNSNKVAFGKVVIGSGNMISGGTFLASSIISGNMEVIGSGLGVLGNLIDAATRLNINITSQIGDVVLNGSSILANTTSDALVGLGDSMKALGTEVNTVANSSSTLIKSIGGTIFNNINNLQTDLDKIVKSRLTKIKDGTISSDSEITYFNSLNSYLKALSVMETVINKLAESVKETGTLNTNDAIVAAANVTAQLVTTDPDATDNPALKAAADLTAALATTNPDDKTNLALSAAANITAALAGLDKNPLETSNPELVAAAELTASLAAPNPEEMNATELSVAEDIDAALEAANIPNDDAMLATANVTAELAAAKPEGTSNLALLAAASITSALANLDPAYHSSKTSSTDSG